jgi:hypothetical protein
VNNDILINTAAIAAEMRIDNPLLKAWGHGCVELYDAIGEWAEIVTEEEDHLNAVLNERDEGWPGVFAYEVTEEVGGSLRERIVANIDITDQWVRQRTRERIAHYCRSALDTQTVIDAYLTRSLATNPAV